MKTRISKLYLGKGIIRYTIEYKKPWWNKWHFIMKDNKPRLFSIKELKLLGYKMK